MSSIVEIGGDRLVSMGSFSGSGPTSDVPRREIGTFGGDLALSSIRIVSFVVKPLTSAFVELGSCLIVDFFLKCRFYKGGCTNAKKLVPLMVKIEKFGFFRLARNRLEML